MGLVAHVPVERRRVVLACDSAAVWEALMKSLIGAAFWIMFWVLLIIGIALIIMEWQVVDSMVTK
jgi:hypothetical protein